MRFEPTGNKKLERVMDVGPIEASEWVDESGLISIVLLKDVELMSPDAVVVFEHAQVVYVVRNKEIHKEEFRLVVEQEEGDPTVAFYKLALEPSFVIDNAVMSAWVVRYIMDALSVFAVEDKDETLSHELLILAKRIGRVCDQRLQVSGSPINDPCYAFVVDLDRLTKRIGKVDGRKRE